ncbi:MAG: pyridoxamine 5'-phosphate oxidase [Bacteroidales bacterium]|jgi:pyridoxamine 5'-phosphate oxidase
MSEIPIFGNRDFSSRPPMDEHSLDRDPFIQFSVWFTDALKSGVAEPEAMFLASANINGIPSGRIVLLKGFDPKGFVFFTNYNSRKGNEIEMNPFAAITFHWKEIERQVRINGKVQKTSDSESDEYFSSRPLESRISAIASLQSQVVPDRKTLEDRFNVVKLQAGETPVRPAHWGGFRIIPDAFEFWQARPNRLHDRIQYSIKDGKWVVKRLFP